MAGAIGAIVGFLIVFGPGIWKKWFQDARKIEQ